MQESAPDWLSHGISALNGLLGDRLERRGNGLAIAMAFYRANEPLDMTPAAIKKAYPDASARLCVFVHGLACNESVWNWSETDTADTAEESTHSYGELLQAERGYTPFYLRYNTGLPIAQNGARFAELLDQLLQNYPQPVGEIVLIGHSMGGLLLRAAAEHGGDWTVRVSRMIYIGTPHAGADLEKLVHVGARSLHQAGNAVAGLIGDVLSLRSQGVKDLRHGAAPSAGESADWLEHAEHYFITGTLTSDADHPVANLLGDALVRLESAVPQAELGPARGFHSQVFPGIHHLSLAHSRVVYAQITAWCGPKRSESP